VKLAFDTPELQRLVLGPAEGRLLVVAWAGALASRFRWCRHDHNALP
jgi:hypothetical protein